ncbi:MAG: hypothetical protein AAFQ68_00060, partial [Bacteroidota bacterium]
MKQHSTLSIATCFWGIVALLLLFPMGSQAQITNFPYFENFDSGAAGWVASAGGNNGWTLGTPAKPIINSAASAPNSWMTGNPTGTHGDNISIYVESPVFDFSSLNRPAISF